jgi:hypothetical protein
VSDLIDRPLPIDVKAREAKSLVSLDSLSCRLAFCPSCNSCALSRLLVAGFGVALELVACDTHTFVSVFSLTVREEIVVGGLHLKPKKYDSRRRVGSG